jgi:ABC-type transporter Mla subunit MlaD
MGDGMTAKTRRRSGVVKYLGNIIDDTKDLVDDLLDRARDIEHDVRDTARKAFDYDDDTNNPDQELAELRLALANLTRKVEELARLQSERRDTKQTS